MVDLKPPKISVLSVENITYDKFDISLNFDVNEPVSQVTYSLDGQENMTISGNTTLTGLANGVHSVTVYAWDVAGNVGTSETTYFSVKVPEPFPFVPVAAVSVVAVALVVAGLLVYHKKRS
jgi:hypothetical protein